MLDGLNKLGLPVKYAIICAGGGLGAAFLANIFGLNRGGATYLSTLIACGIGGAIGGWLRKRKGKNS